MNERKQILEMVAEGKITVDEAERLIAALERTPDEGAAPEEPRRPRPRYLRVVAVDNDGDSRSRVNVRVPFSLLRAGVKLASLVPPQALGFANDKLRQKGVAIDLTQLKPEQLEELVEHLGDLTVDVEESDSKVQVFAE